MHQDVEERGHPRDPALQQSYIQLTDTHTRFPEEHSQRASRPEIPKLELARHTYKLARFVLTSSSAEYT